MMLAAAFVTDFRISVVVSIPSGNEYSTHR